MSRGRLAALLRGQTSSTIRRMRLKLVATAMGATTLVLAMVIVGMDVLSWHDLCDRVDGVVDLIEEAGGALGNLDVSDDSQLLPRGIAWEALQEVPYDARYFTVTFDGDGETLDSNLSSIASVDEPAARAKARDVFLSGATEGFDGDYRFRVVPTDQGSMVIFLYCYDDLNYFHAFLRASVIMGLLGLAAFAAIVVPFAISAARPVEETQERQRRFVTDASHELRTPISIIGSATDVIEIESGESEWTQSIHNQTRRLEDLTNKLVALAKADEGGRSLSLADMDVSTVALGLAEDFESVSQAQGKPMSCDIARGVHCLADASMVEQTISILLDNAFKHSCEGASVRFELSAVGGRGMGDAIGASGADDSMGDTGGVGGLRAVGAPARERDVGHVRLAVSNDVEGMAAGPHPELFGRFYRTDESRRYSGGHGIGLAVVRAVAEAHGGSANAHCDGRRLTVEVRI